MKLLRIEKTNFTAGNIRLKNLPENNLQTLDAIKKIAEDKDIDIFIGQNKHVKNLPIENIYTIIASKSIPIIERVFYKTGVILKKGEAFAIMSKNASKEEMSVRVYNAVITAIENLEKKLSVTK